MNIMINEKLRPLIEIGLVAVVLQANRNLLVVMAAHAVPDALSIISSYQAQ